MKRLETITKQFLTEEKKHFGRPIELFVSGSNLHPNPKLYKYYFWIYAENSDYESAADIFFKDAYKLNIKTAVDKMNELRNNKISYAYVNTKYYRLGNKIFNYEGLMQNDPQIIFSPSYEDDKDEIIEGGHK